MKYFINPDERIGTVYHEFCKGKWDGKTFWKSDSILLSDDIMYQAIGFVDTIVKIIPNYDCFGETEIFVDKWNRIGEIIISKDKVSQEIYNELNEWLIDVFKEHNCFTILGI